MMSTRPEPLNSKLARVTPRWAFKQSSRRALVVILCIMPLLFTLPNWAGEATWSLLMVIAAVLACFVSIAWLIGATYAKADTPDMYLDEREIAMRNEVYLKSFRIIGALISLGFVMFTVFPDTPVPARGVFGLLFPIVIFLPTCVLAWTQPDPLEEV